jgi:hypothetical protein
MLLTTLTLLSLASSSPTPSVEPEASPPVGAPTVPDPPTKTAPAEGEPAEGEPAEGESAEAEPAEAEPEAPRGPAVDDETAPMQAPVEAAPPIPAPRRRGIGLFIAGGILGAVGLPLKIVATTSDTSTAREYDAGLIDPDDCVESCYAGPLFNVISAPLLITSASLVSGGLSLHGRWAAHRDVARRRPPYLLRTRLMTGLGAGLIVAGVATFIGSRFALQGPHASASASGFVSIRELGWWSAVIGIYGGAGLVGYGTGYRAGRRTAEPKRQAQVAPLVSPQLMGVGVSGRF